MCEIVSVNASMSEKVCICQQVNVNACECLCWGNTSRIQEARKTQLIPESAPFNGRHLGLTVVSKHLLSMVINS